MRTIREQVLTARKKHTCGFCGCTIEKGDVYHRQCIVDEGEIYDWLSHPECERAVGELDMMEDIPCGDGITGMYFCACVDDYMRDNHLTPKGNYHDDVLAALEHKRNQNQKQ